MKVEDGVIEALSKYLRRKESKIIETCEENGIHSLAHLIAMEPEELADIFEINKKTAAMIITYAETLRAKAYDREQKTKRAGGTVQEPCTGNYLSVLGILHVSRGTLPTILKAGSLSGKTLTATFLTDTHIKCTGSTVTVAAITHKIPYTKAGILIDDIQFATAAPGVEKVLSAMTEGIKASGSNIMYEGSADTLVNIIISNLAFIITYQTDAEGVNWPEPLRTRDVRRMMVVPLRSIKIGLPVLVSRWADGMEFARTIHPTSETANDIDLMEENDKTNQEVEDWTQVIKNFNDCVEDSATVRQNWTMTVAARIMGEDRILALKDEVRPPRDPDLVDWWYDLTYQIMFEYYDEFKACREAPIDSHVARVATTVFTTTVDMGTALAREGWDIDEDDVILAAENSITTAIRLYGETKGLTERTYIKTVERVLADHPIP